jgi:hypothetical protein
MVSLRASGTIGSIHAKSPSRSSRNRFGTDMWASVQEFLSGVNAGIPDPGAFSRTYLALLAETRFTETSGNGVVVIRGSVQWIALVVVLGILGICGTWWLIHRRAWNPHSRSNEDEAMRRHVNRNYD